MDINELRDKMSQMHSDMLKRMLGLNELPEFLLKRYFALKRLTDKVDAPMSPMDLVRIALDCGLNLETMRFHNGDQHTFSKPEPESEPEPEPESEPDIPNGKSVTILWNNQLTKGFIDSSERLSNGEFRYTINLENGETVELMKEDIEVN